VIILALAFFLITLIPNVSAACTLTFDNTNYSSLQTIQATTSCSSGNERNQLYTITWRNTTDVIEIDTGTTPGTIGQNFFETYVIPSGSEDTTINATMNGTNLEGNDNASVSGAASNILIIKNVNITNAPILIGQVAGIHFSVIDENNKKVSGAICSAVVQDGTSVPLGTLDEPVEVIDGIAAFARIIRDEVFDENRQYVASIHCSCGAVNTSKACFNEDEEDVTNSVGTTNFPFSIDKWLNVNTVVDRSNYTMKEEIAISVNVTNINFSKRIPIEIFYQVRCSADKDNDFDLDRSLIVSDNNQPDERGINNGTTQMQTKRFIIPEVNYLQGKTSECYASTTVWVLNTMRERVISYATTSPKFNITSDELNLQLDWQKINDYTFNTIVNLSKDSFREYNGSGTGNIDIRLNNLNTQSIDSSKQTDISPISFTTLLDTKFIKNVTVVNNSSVSITNALEFLEDGNLEIELRNVDLSRTGWYNVTLELNNFEERNVEAVETVADAKIINRLNSSIYFNTETIPSSDVTETTLMEFSINIIKEPDFGNDFKVTYRFYPRSGRGELVDEIETEVDGTGNHTIFLRSDDLNPDGDSEIYQVISTVSMRNQNGLFEDFSSTVLGNLTVTSKGLSGEGSLSGGGVGTSGPYDVIVNTTKR